MTENEKNEASVEEVKDEKKKPSEEEIQAWLDGVHYGSCCADDPEDCQEQDFIKKRPRLKSLFYFQGSLFA